MSVLAIIWFVLIAVLICGYFVLDGFDLGSGVLYPFLARTEEDRAVVRRAIGPVWDGNEVWLLTAGGALFAAFPAAYATSFSGFYLAIMLVLFGLIVRAVALEFRAHDAAWAKLYDALFFVGSLLPALLFGVAVGNVIEGLPLDLNGDYTGSFFALLNPYALLCGLLGLAHMLTQGAGWLSCKAPEGSAVLACARKLRSRLAIAELVVFAATAVVYFVGVLPRATTGIAPTPLAVVCALVFVAAAVLVARGRAGDVALHVANGVGCAALVGMFAASIFPVLIPATDPARAITVANAASSDYSLAIMLAIACIGVPLVLVYHVVVYRVFRGRLTARDLTY